MAFCERCKNFVDFIRADLEASKNLIPGVYRRESNAIFRLDIKVSLGCSLCFEIFRLIIPWLLFFSVIIKQHFILQPTLSFMRGPNILKLIVILFVIKFRQVF